MEPRNLVTEEHIVAALRSDKGPDVHLISWELNDFTKKGENFASFITSITIKYSLNQTNSEVKYIVKANGCRPDSQELYSGFFDKEVRFYADLLPQLNSLLTDLGHEPLRVPRYIHGNLAYGEQLIFFEDLRQRGFRMHNRKLGLDAKHINLTFKELARLHAASCLLQQETPDKDLAVAYDFLAKDIKEYCSGEVDPMLRGLRYHIDLACQLLVKFNASENVIAWTKNLVPNLKDIIKHQLGSSKNNVVCHGDCWSNNLLFRYNDDGEPQEVMLLDFQQVHRGSWAVDINQILYVNTTSDVRKNHLESFLHTYHTAFLNVSGSREPIFTKEQQWQEFRDRNLFGCINAIAGIPVLMMEFEEWIDAENKDTENWSDWEKEFAKRLMQTQNSEMKSRFLSVFEDMIEVGLIPK